MIRVGIILEGWLCKDNTIVEPKKYGFPTNEFGLNVVFKSVRSHRKDEIKESLYAIIDKYERVAKQLDMNLSFASTMAVPKELFYIIEKKYHHRDIVDNTANIYAGTSESHRKPFRHIEGNHYMCTASCQVQFSKFDIYDNYVRIYQLPIYRMVQKMDDAFNNEILEHNRIPGEFEIKPRTEYGGFIYRSLPAEVNIDKVLEVAFSIVV